MSGGAAKTRHVRLPGKPPMPSAKTIAAMKAARRGELTTVGKPDQLLRRLNAKK